MAKKNFIIMITALSYFQKPYFCKKFFCMDATKRKQIIELIKNEVVPAIGCTEPVAVALAVAKAKETLGNVPEKIEVLLSDNVLKNAMGVGIPGTGMIGLPISIALGALVGKSEYGLEVLKDVNADAIANGKRMIDEKRISIKRKTGITEKLYIEAICYAGNDQAKAIIACGHANFIHISRNEDVVFEKKVDSSECKDSECCHLSMRKVYDFATTAPIDEISFIHDAKWYS